MSLKRPLAVVLEEHVAAADRRDVEIRVAVVVDVGERGRDADLGRHAHAGRGRDVLEPAAAEIPPELVPADLVHEIDVGASVAVDVRHREAVAVVVVHRLVGLAGVVDDAVLEGDAAFGEAVGELKVVERGESGRRPRLRGGESLEPRRVLEIGRDVADRDVLGGDADEEHHRRRDSCKDRSSVTARYYIGWRDGANGRANRRWRRGERDSVAAMHNVAADESRGP